MSTNKKRFWLAMSVATVAATSGCSTMNSFSLWPSSWSSAKSGAPSSSVSQAARNTSPVKASAKGANAQLGASAAASSNPLTSMTASLKKWTKPDDAAKQAESDPLSLDNKNKQAPVEVLVQVARMHEAKSDFASAVKQYEQALKIEPNNTDLLVGLARASDRAGDMPKAISTYQQAIKIDPKCALAYNDLGLCYARQKDLARSQQSLQKAVSLVPDSKLYRNNYATVLVESRKYDDALEQLSTVNSPAVANYNLGILANRSGDKNEALSRFKQAAVIDPQLVAAQKMIDKLNGVSTTTNVAASTLGLPDTATQVSAQAQAASQAVQSQLANQSRQVADQAKQAQSQLQDQGRQAAQQWKNQAQLQLRQVKTEVGTTQTNLTQQAQAKAQDVQAKTQALQGQVNQGVASTSESAQAAVRDAEAKLRAALQSQSAPVAPAYTGQWSGSRPNNDITPIKAEPNTPVHTGQTKPRYTVSDDNDSENLAPILLPPTNE